ncbi:MAG: adenylate cyclase regulatory domain-containing protein [Solirubrobacterales bacterium]
MSDESITLAEAARRSGVSTDTLRRWANEGIVPLDDGTWTRAAASQARVVARMRDRGHSLEDLREAAAEGRLAVGLAEDVFADDSEQMTVAEAAERTGVEEEFVERLLDLLGTPVGENRTLSEEDRKAIARLASVAEAGLPLEAVLQLVRIYAQSVRRIADAEVRLVHLFVHEPMIRDGMSASDISEELSDIAANTAPTAVPLFKYLHQRYLRYFMEQDVVGHMEDEAPSGADIGEVKIAICFIDLTGFTQFTEEEGDIEALLVIENFTDAVRETLPPRAEVIKSIGDEVMVVSPDPASLAEWAVGFISFFSDRPKPRAGVHYAGAVFRDGDYFGSQVNLAHRVVNRALGGEVLVTDTVAESLADHEEIELEPSGEVPLKGVPEPTPLFSVKVRG